MEYYPNTEISFLISGWLNLLAKRMGLPNGRCVPHSEAYVTALYYSCTSLTTVGFGNVSANTTWEKIFSVVIMLIGGKKYMFKIIDLDRRSRYTLDS